MKRLPVIALAGFVVLGCVATIWAYWGRGYSPGISFDSFQAIKEGMTKKKVEEILGGPPRWEFDEELPPEAALYCVGSLNNAEEWWGSSGVIKVYYTEKGVVWKKSFERLPFTPTLRLSDESVDRSKDNKAS